MIPATFGDILFVIAACGLGLAVVYAFALWVWDKIFGGLD